MPLFPQAVVMTGGPGEAVKDFKRALDNAGFSSPEGASVCWLLYEEVVTVFRRHTRTHSHTTNILVLQQVEGSTVWVLCSPDSTPGKKPAFPRSPCLFYSNSTNCFSLILLPTSFSYLTMCTSRSRDQYCCLSCAQSRAWHKDLKLQQIKRKRL